jgi:hypothetical protein
MKYKEGNMRENLGAINGNGRHNWKYLPFLVK